ncbi:DUF6597 domain-containing transcriptional factor [Actinomadura namibiensis]|uniref:DUF6597 domain-containing transcriptional factor n=1 Tax=Actinomadura kijaniata TaxID=46161 RepID=UPI003617B6CA
MQGVVNPTGYRETAADATQVTAGVACVWESALPAGAEPFTQRVVPDGCVDVVWWAARGLVQVAGPDTGPVPATIGPGDRLVGVRFRPGAAVLALGVPGRRGAGRAGAVAGAVGGRRRAVGGGAGGCGRSGGGAGGGGGGAGGGGGSGGSAGSGAGAGAGGRGVGAGGRGRAGVE